MPSKSRRLSRVVSHTHTLRARQRISLGPPPTHGTFSCSPPRHRVPCHQFHVHPRRPGRPHVVPEIFCRQYSSKVHQHLKGKRRSRSKVRRRCTQEILSCPTGPASDAEHRPIPTAASSPLRPTPPWAWLPLLNLLKEKSVLVDKSMQSNQHARSAGIKTFNIAVC